jgi:hypothetical protein
MKAEQMLEELERAAEKVGVRVSYEALAADTIGQGGLCKVKGEWRAIIDRHATAGEKVSLLAQLLAGFDLEAVFLSPQVRELVQKKLELLRAAEGAPGE